MRVTALTSPAVSSNMTTAELVRAAEHTFSRPSPLVAAMIARLCELDDAASSTPATEHAVNCPACGAELHLDTTED